MESRGLPCSQASPAWGPSSEPIKATPYMWVPGCRWESQVGFQFMKGVSLLPIHTKVPELELMPLETPQALPLTLVHGTFWKHWPSILLKGLSCQGRTHIHLASGLPGDPGVISGQCHLHLFCPPRSPTKGHSFFCVKPPHSLAWSSILPPPHPTPTPPYSPTLVVLAGMRPNCEVAVFIDGPLALAGKCAPCSGSPRSVSEKHWSHL